MFRFLVLLVALCAPAAAEKNELAIALGLRAGGDLEIAGTSQFRISERLAFRLEGRIYATLTSASFAGRCVSGACTFAVSGSGALQFEALGALVFRFGS